MSKTPRKPDKPVLWIIAGPNGSGKSSLYNRTDIEGWGGSIWIINPDLLTQSILEREGVPLAAANLEAVRRVEDWLYASVRVYQTIGVETVLSSSKYRKLAEAARAAGFLVQMIYVVLESAELQAERVRIRVQSGGHDVPAEKIAARRARSFEQLAWFLGMVDRCYVYDNSTGTPELAAERTRPNELLCWRPLPDDMNASLAAAGIKLLDYKPLRD